VREALLRLQSEGLLRLLPKRGALVLPVTADELADVIETRRMVESYAVRKVIVSGQIGELDLELGRQLAAMRDAAQRRDTAAYVAADRAFHAEIVAAAGNEIIADLYRSLRERQLRMGTVNLLDETGAADPSRMRDTLREHERIRSAIASKHLRAADAAVTGHLDHAERLLARNR
jgi:DNA-binding GntR family transcriptional regulator